MCQGCIFSCREAFVGHGGSREQCPAHDLDLIRALD